jgi:hypothetical protein
MISLNTTEITTYDVWNPGIGLGQAQNHDGVKPVYVIYALQNQATYYFLISNLRFISSPFYKEKAKGTKELTRNRKSEDRLHNEQKR